MFTLAINTASFTESVALFTEKKILTELSWRGKSDESEKLLSAIFKLLKRAKKKWNDLKRIIVINGPGPFSAVRIGVTTANVLGFSLGIPVFSISSEKFFRMRAPEKNAVLLLHAGGSFVAVSGRKLKTKVCKISDLITLFPLAPLRRPSGSGSDRSVGHPSSLVFYGDLTSDELNELLKNKSFRFIPENKLKSFGETIFNVRLSLSRKGKSASATARQAKPLYWRPPNITKPKNV